MPVTNEQLVIKFTAITNGLGRMTPKEREAQPTMEFAEDYNKARTLALQLNSDLADVFPPAVKIQHDQFFHGVVGRYGEVFVYAQQIIGFLARGSSPVTLD